MTILEIQAKLDDRKQVVICVSTVTLHISKLEGYWRTKPYRMGVSDTTADRIEVSYYKTFESMVRGIEILEVKKSLELIEVAPLN